MGSGLVGDVEILVHAVLCLQRQPAGIIFVIRPRPWSDVLLVRVGIILGTFYQLRQGSLLVEDRSFIVIFIFAENQTRIASRIFAGGDEVPLTLTVRDRPDQLVAEEGSLNQRNTQTDGLFHTVDFHLRDDERIQVVHLFVQRLGADDDVLVQPAVNREVLSRG